MSHIDIGTYKKPSKTLKPPPYPSPPLPCFCSCLYPKNKHEIPKCLPDYPKKKMQRFNIKSKYIPYFVLSSCKLCFSFVHLPDLGPIHFFFIIEQKLVQRCVTQMEAQSCKVTYALTVDHFEQKKFSKIIGFIPLPRTQLWSLM